MYPITSQSYDKVCTYSSTATRGYGSRLSSSVGRAVKVGVAKLLDPEFIGNGALWKNLNSEPEGAYITLIWKCESRVHA